MRWLLLVGALALCGCQQALDGGKTVLRVANWGGAGDDSDYHRIIQEVYAEFEAQNPDIELQIEGIPGSQDYVRKLLLAHIAGAEPDVITLDASSAAVFIENDVLLDLSGLAAGDATFSWDDYFPNVVEIAQRGDARYAVPLDFTPMVMYYNRQHFDEAGVPYPEPGWTWDDFLAKAKALTTEERHGYKFANWMPGWIMWLWNNGGDVLEDGRAGSVLDSAENVEAVEWLEALIKEHKVAPELSQMAAMGVDPFLQGEAAMEISGHWSLIGYTGAEKIDVEEIGVAPLPTRTGESVTVMYESGLAIAKSSPNKEAAWKFIRYMSSADVQRKIQSTGIAICGRKDIAAERADNPREQAFLEIVPSARGPWGAYVEGYDFVESEGQKMMDKVLKNGIPAPQALQEMAAAVDRHLESR